MAVTSNLLFLKTEVTMKQISASLDWLLLKTKISATRYITSWLTKAKR